MVKIILYVGYELFKAYFRPNGIELLGGWTDLEWECQNLTSWIPSFICVTDTWTILPPKDQWQRYVNKAIVFPFVYFMKCFCFSYTYWLGKGLYFLKYNTLQGESPGFVRNDNFTHNFYKIFLV